MSEDITSFKIFPWNDNFSTGIDIIDEQHKVLVDILNKLAIELCDISEDFILNETFNELAEYAKYHFKEEELIWDEYFQDDSWNIEHKKTHNSFMDGVIEIKNNKDKKPLYDVIFDIISFLSKWLAYHILDTDRHMSYVVKELKNGISLVSAKTMAEDTMNSSKKIILDTILNMYDILFKQKSRSYA